MGRPAIVRLAAVAAIVVAVVSVVVLQPHDSPTPAAALTEAAENTAEALTLRSEYVQPNQEGGFNVVRSEHRGADLRRTFSVIDADGIEQPSGEDDEFVVYIGDQGWTPRDGAGEGTIVRPEERNAPYAEASAAIIQAAVTEATVEEVGEEDVRGVEATHYRVVIDDGVIDRLAQLPRHQLSGFELEDPSMIRSLDVWIADDLIRRLRVTQTWEPADSPGTTVEFYDFGADITISPPS